VRNEVEADSVVQSYDINTENCELITTLHPYRRVTCPSHEHTATDSSKCKKNQTNKKRVRPRSTSAHVDAIDKIIEKDTHAIPAACNVEMKPEIIALAPIRAMSRVRDGASADSTPICMPSEPRFANPHSAYEAIVNPRFDSGSLEAIKASRSRYAANSFSMSLVARSSETRRISERGTPVRCKARRSSSDVRKDG
jgi:hypothetical protein